MHHILGAYAVAFLPQTLGDVEEPILAQDAQPFPEANLETWQRTVDEANVSRTTVG